MITTDPAARLRERVKSRMYYAGHRDEYGVMQPDPHLEATADAALDTLIAYHRAASAVEALEPVRCEVWVFAGEKCEARWPNGNGWCDRCNALAAAQARLAAYKEDR